MTVQLFPPPSLPAVNGDALLDASKIMLRRLRQIYLPIQDAAIALYARAVRNGPYIRERFAAADPLRDAKRAAIYVHFDENGVVHDFALHQLRELVAAGFRVTFVSNSPVFPSEGRERVAPFCKEVLWRQNFGYDVGAYKDSIATIDDLDGVESLILMNDSVYGPFSGFATALDRAESSATDFWGIAESFEDRRHIQGFFLVFFPKAFLSDAFARFWDDLPYVNHKWWIVRNAELKLTRILERAGLKGGVLAPYAPLATIAKKRMVNLAELTPRLREGDDALNPMQYFWDILIEDFGVPFIKRDLLQNNPEDIPNVERWRSVIAANSQYDTAMIDSHLAYLRSGKKTR